MESTILLTASPADYRRLVAGRRKAAVLPVAICAAAATAIVVADYRLMLIAFVVSFPALIFVLDAVVVACSAAAIGSAEVRCDGEWLTVNAERRMRVDAITLVRVQPDAVTLVERVSPQRLRGHLLAVDDLRTGPLLAKLQALGRTVREEPSTLAGVQALIWKVLNRLVLGPVAALLLLCGLGFLLQGPGWEAAACFGGVGACVLLGVVGKLRRRVRPA